MSHNRTREDPRSLEYGGREFRAATDARTTRLIRAHLAAAACVDCGERDPLVLQFDHVERKTTDVSWLVGSGCSPVRLRRELVRGEMRCANCHRRRTTRARGWYRTRVASAPEPDVELGAKRPAERLPTGRASDPGGTDRPLSQGASSGGSLISGAGGG